MSDTRPNPPEGMLRLLQTTDLHMQLFAFDYLADTARATRSLMGLSEPIRTAREGAPATVLLDAGDFLQGNALADFLAEQRLEPHPMIAALNHLRYDAVTLGNHEFEYGLPFLRATLSALEAEVVSANLSTGPGEPFVAPWTILDRDIPCSDGVTRPVRIGVIGFAPPQIVDWNADVLRDGLTASDAVSSALTQIPRLRRAGADIVVALCHGGPSTDPTHFKMENPATALAELRGVDVVLMGHLHGCFPGPDFDTVPGADVARGTLCDTPAMMPGAHGSHLGQMDLKLTIDSDGDWQIADHEIRLVPAMPVQGLPEDLSRGLPAELVTAHETVRARLSRTVCETPVRLSTHFACVGIDDTAELMAQVQIEAIARKLAGTAYADLPILASTAPFQAGGHGGPRNYFDLMPGPLRLRHCHGLAPFDNPVCAVVRRGWQIRAWLERSATFFSRIEPGRADQPLTDDHIAPYHLDTIHGLSYEIDLSRPAHTAPPGTGGKGRIRALTLGGEPLCDDTQVVVATGSYRAHGGGGHVTGDSSDIVATTDSGLRRLLVEALSRGQVTPRPGAPVWRFTPVEGASAIFQSAPNAARHPPAGLPITPMPGLADGFARFRLDLG